MSNALAIAAVTATLRNLLEAINHKISGTIISTKPPDEARSDKSNQLNLFLYQVLPNAAWRNMDIPQVTRSGSTSAAPLALNLYYMLTAYGKDNDDVAGHQLLGQAMSILFDHCLLGSKEIQDALPSTDNSELQNQVERVRLTLQPLSVEEIFRLWSGFQTQYRVSVAYEVAVVLIESIQPTSTPLRVLTRNVIVRPFHQPIIEAILPEAITSDSKLTIQGQNLKGDIVQVNFGTTLVAPQTVSDKQIIVSLPGPPNELLAGINSVQVIHQFIFGSPDSRQRNQLPLPTDPPTSLPTDPHRGFESNIRPFVLRPVINQINASPLVVDADGITTATVHIVLKPPIGKTQRVRLLLNEFNPPLDLSGREDRSARAYSFSAPARDKASDPKTSPSIDIPIKGVVAGQYLARVQVDGAESLLDVDNKQESATFHQYINPKVNIQ